jgi:hypothetical protein
LQELQSFVIAHEDNIGHRQSNSVVVDGATTSRRVLIIGRMRFDQAPTPAGSVKEARRLVSPPPSLHIADRKIAHSSRP